MGCISRISKTESKTKPRLLFQPFLIPINFQMYYCIYIVAYCNLYEIKQSSWMHPGGSHQFAFSQAKKWRTEPWTQMRKQNSAAKMRSNTASYLAFLRGFKASSLAYSF